MQMAESSAKAIPSSCRRRVVSPNGPPQDFQLPVHKRIPPLSEDWTEPFFWRNNFLLWFVCFVFKREVFNIHPALSSENLNLNSADCINQPPNLKRNTFCKILIENTLFLKFCTGGDASISYPIPPNSLPQANSPLLFFSFYQVMCQTTFTVV